MKIVGVDELHAAFVMKAAHAAMSGAAYGNPGNGMASTLAQLDHVSRLFGRFAALRKVSLSFDCRPLLRSAGREWRRQIHPAAHPRRTARADPGHRPHLYRRQAGTRLPSQRARIGYMSHAPMLYDELSARKICVTLPVSIARCSCLTPEEALLAVGLDPALDSPGRPVSRRVCASALPSPGCCCRSPNCCCSTSRSPTWMPPARARWWRCLASLARRTPDRRAHHASEIARRATG